MGQPWDQVPIRFTATLALVMTSGPVSLYAISALAPLIAADLGLSSGRLGILAFFTFGAAAISAIMTGRLVDHWTARRMEVLLFVGAGISLVLIASATSFAVLIAAMVMSGVAQSASNPLTNKLISLHVKRGRQGTVVGIKQSGVQVGQFFAGAALPSLAQYVGWRWSVSACLLLVGFGMVLALIAQPARSVQMSVGSDNEGPGGGHNLPIRRLAIYTFCNGALVATVNVHLPLYAHEGVGLSPAFAGALAAIIGGLGIVGRVAWARIAERHRTYVRPLKGLAVVSLMAVGLLWAASVFGGTITLLLGTVMYAASALPGNAVAMFAVIREAGRQKTGSATGTMMLALYLGFTFGPWMFGLLTDAFDGYTAAWLFAVAIAIGSLIALSGMTEPVQDADDRSILLA